MLNCFYVWNSLSLSILPSVILNQKYPSHYVIYLFCNKYFLSLTFFTRFFLNYRGGHKGYHGPAVSPDVPGPPAPILGTPCATDIWYHLCERLYPSLFQYNLTNFNIYWVGTISKALNRSKLNQSDARRIMLVMLAKYIGFVYTMCPRSLVHLL